MSDAIPLLVPMRLEALLVNEKLRNDPDRPFQRWSMNYRKLNDFLDPDPEPFASVEDAPPAGVHLHWRLPRALTHGRGDGASPVRFPLAPNRWIVVRRATTAGATTAPALVAWVVESDYVGADGTSAFADPSSQPGAVKPTKIGRRRSIAQWSESGGRLFLTATGVADVTFTAYQPGVLNVFAFHDETTTALPEHTALSYLVAGWYSDASEDPLAERSPDALEWLVLGAGAGAPRPTLTIPHAMVSGIDWQTTVPPARVDSDPSAMQVAVGYTAVDALAAIVAAKAGGGDAGADLQTKLQAFQYDMLATLDAEDGTAQLEERIRAAWFGTTSGGTRWEIVPVSQGQATDVGIDDAPVPPAAPLRGAQAAWLADLNVRQRAYDAGRRELRTMQWELFALWFKARRIAVPTVRAALQRFRIDPRALETMLRQALDAADDRSALYTVASRRSALEEAATALPDATSPASIAEWARRIPRSRDTANDADTPALTLKPVALAAFTHPADPVLLVSGITPPAHAQDDDAPLPCRVVDAAVTGVRVGDATITRGSRSLATVITLPKTERLPAAVAAAIAALSVEAFFADPDNAASIVVNGTDSKDARVIDALRTDMAHRDAQRATIATPLRAAFAFARWRQAWSPLYLQWKLTWFPSVTSAPVGPYTPAPAARYPGKNAGGAIDNWPFEPEPWAFDGSDDVTARGSEYYRWTGGDPWKGQDAANIVYAGRTFLTPQATTLFMRRLADYVRLHPDDPDLEEIQTLIGTVGATRFLSQSLSGFNAAFVMRGLSRAAVPTPDSPEARAIDGENRGVPLVALGDQSFDFDSGTPFFFPVRGGFFQFERLQIVDAFGQVLDLMSTNGNSTGEPKRFTPIRGAGLAPGAGSGIDTPERRVLQAPRIVQPSRVVMRLLDAERDAREVFYHPDANPVCGWLLPNHLDRSIAVYDAAAEPLGELLVLADEWAAERVQWLPAPGAATPIRDPSRIANRHLAAMLSAFTDAQGGIPPADRVGAFRALYKSIDETLWMVDPPGTMGDRDLAVLIGRPLAMVRAQVQLELLGAPATNQSWRDTLQALDAGLTTIEFPIRLGSTELLDDGLIGYFANDAFDRFDAVHASKAARSPYVLPVAPGTYPSLRFDHPTYTPLTLTLLMDPRARVHATTGILPTATLELPSQFYVDALSRMAITFRTGPVLTQPDAIRLPFPAERAGTWGWVRRVGRAGTQADWRIDPIAAANAQARLADAPPHLMDGWLQFTPAKGTLRTGDET